MSDVSEEILQLEESMMRRKEHQEKLWTIRVPRTVAVRTVRVEVRGGGLSPHGEPPQFL